jgi:hypothetical protein
MALLQFLEETDFKGTLASGVLTTLKGANSENLAQSEQLAISELSCLYDKYDIAGELAKTGTARNKELVRMVVAITAYYLYNTVPDIEIPDRVKDNFEKEYKHVLAVCKGLSSTIDALTNSDGETVTRFRFDADTQRSHDPFYM